MSGTVTAARSTDISREDLVTPKGLQDVQNGVTQLALIGLHVSGILKLYVYVRTLYDIVMIIE